MCNKIVTRHEVDTVTHNHLDNRNMKIPPQRKKKQILDKLTFENKSQKYDVLPEQKQTDTIKLKYNSNGRKENRNIAR